MLYDVLAFTEGSLGGLRWHEKVLEGFPYRSALALAQALGMTPSELMQQFGTPDAPLGRRLSAHQSEAALRIALAMHRLATALPKETTPDAVAAMMRETQPQLGGHPPLTLLRTVAGTSLVLEWIGRLQRAKPTTEPVAHTEEHTEAASESED